MFQFASLLSAYRFDATCEPLSTALSSGAWRCSCTRAALESAARARLRRAGTGAGEVEFECERACLRVNSSVTRATDAMLKLLKLRRARCAMRGARARAGCALLLRTTSFSASP